MQYYNTHCHVFTMRNAPKEFLHLYLPGIAADIVDGVSNTKVGSATMRFLLSKLGGNWGKRYASFLKIGKSTDQLTVFENLRNQYTDDQDIKFVALTMYMEKCGAGVSETGFEGQLEGIFIAKKRYPDNILLFLGIDPRWQSSGTELRKIVEKYFETKLDVNATRSVYPFAGLKLYPSMGFYAFDENLKETFEWAADNGVPIVSHCNYLGGIFNNETSYIQGNLNPFDVYTNQQYNLNFPGSPPPTYRAKKNWFKKILGTADNDNNLNNCSYFLEPASYRSVIEYFNGKGKPLKICLAHYGGSDHILNEANNTTPSTLFGMVQQNWCGQIKDLIRYYENVYTDISYALSNNKIFDPVFNDMNDPILGQRILFGTDFFLTERELDENTDYSNFKTAAKMKPLSNYQNVSAWDQMASKNANQFLASKYFP